MRPVESALIDTLNDLKLEGSGQPVHTASQNILYMIAEECRPLGNAWFVISLVIFFTLVFTSFVILSHLLRTIWIGPRWLDIAVSVVVSVIGTITYNLIVFHRYFSTISTNIWHRLLFGQSPTAGRPKRRASSR